MSGMAIASLVAWMWMAAQSGNVQIAPDLTKPRPILCYGIRADGNPGTMPCPELITNMLPVQGAEHVIEIKTRREDLESAIWNQPCPDGKEEVWIPRDGQPTYIEFKTCAKVTREIWIDGAKWGILRESEGK